MDIRIITKREAVRPRRVRPTEAERELAAKIRVRVDQRQKQKTPPWIIALAGQSDRSA